MPWSQENYVFVHFLYKCKYILVGSWEMTVMVKCLPWKREEPRVDSQNLCTKLGTVAHTCNLSTKGTEAGGSLMSCVFN